MTGGQKVLSELFRGVWLIMLTLGLFGVMIVALMLSKRVPVDPMQALGLCAWFVIALMARWASRTIGRDAV